MKLRYYQKFLISIIIYCLVTFITFTTPTLAGEEAVDIYFFHSKTCPHCLQQKPVMENVAQLNREIKLHAYEVSEQPKIWRGFLDKHRLKSEAVPRTVIGDKQFIGYSERDGKLEYNQVYQGYIGYKNQIITAIETELGHPVNLAVIESERTDNISDFSLTWQILGLPILYLLAYLVLRKKLLNRYKQSHFMFGLISVTIISIFVISMFFNNLHVVSLKQLYDNLFSIHI